MKDFYDVVVIGGGAAGLMCAIVAGRRGRSVLVIEGSNKLGKKILMSGGGRCNFTNLHCSPSDFVSANPNFCISALSRYTPQDFVALVERHGIAYHEKTLGQLFCDRSSKDILAMLVAECAQANVAIVTHCDVATVEFEQQFSIATGTGDYACESLVIATGGLSIPKMGASDFGYRLARQFDIEVCPTRAGLVPYTFTGPMLDMTSQLSGISIDATIWVGGKDFRGDLLFTHRGLSGPAALQSSNHWSSGSVLEIDLLPGMDASEYLLQSKSDKPQGLLRVQLFERLPRALVQALEASWWPDIAESKMATIRTEGLRQIGAQLQGWQMLPSGTEGYRTAEVTLGGVDTNALSSKTMESRQHPGLYFIGEVVDVTGQLGGFNFQWAWASAHAAGCAV